MGVNSRGPIYRLIRDAWDTFLRIGSVLLSILGFWLGVGIWLIAIAIPTAIIYYAGQYLGIW